MKFYNEQERRIICNVLATAKYYLQTPEDVRNGNTKSGKKEPAICYATDLTGYSIFQRSLACEVIMDRLAPWASVPNWLRENIGTEVLQIPMGKRQEVFQEYRHRWLDALIKEFSE